MRFTAGGLKPFTLDEPVDRNEIELGFRLKRTSWGQGLAREAGARLIEFGLEELRLRRLLGVAHEENAASKRVVEQLGFRFLRRIDYWDNFELRPIERSTAPAAQ